MKRKLAIILLVVALGAGLALGLLRAFGGSSHRALLPDVARIVCGLNRYRVLTPEVRPLSDGVHLRIENWSGSKRDFLFHLILPGETRMVVAYPPGRILVGCTDLNLIPDPGPANLRPQPGPHEVPLRVVDQQGLFRPYRPCPPQHVPAGMTPPGDVETALAAGPPPVRHGSLVEVARRDIAGIRQGDRLVKQGYPTVLQHDSATVQVLRRGYEAAEIVYQKGGPATWLLLDFGACVQYQDQLKLRLAG